MGNRTSAKDLYHCAREDTRLCGCREPDPGDTAALPQQKWLCKGERRRVPKELYHRALFLGAELPGRWQFAERSLLLLGEGSVALGLVGPEGLRNVAGVTQKQVNIGTAVSEGVAVTLSRLDRSIRGLFLILSAPRSGCEDRNGKGPDVQAGASGVVFLAHGLSTEFGDPGAKAGTRARAVRGPRFRPSQADVSGESAGAAEIDQKHLRPSPLADCPKCVDDLAAECASTLADLDHVMGGFAATWGVDALAQHHVQLPPCACGTHLIALALHAGREEGKPWHVEAVWQHVPPGPAVATKPSPGHCIVSALEPVAAAISARAASLEAEQETRVALPCGGKDQQLLFEHRALSYAEENAGYDALEEKVTGLRHEAEDARRQADIQRWKSAQLQQALDSNEASLESLNLTATAQRVRLFQWRKEVLSAAKDENFEDVLAKISTLPSAVFIAADEDSLPNEECGGSMPSSNRGSLVRKDISEAPTTISGSITVGNVDVAALQSNLTFKADVENACTTYLASATEVSPADVAISLSQGSVGFDVSYTIMVPESHGAAALSSLSTSMAQQSIFSDIDDSTSRSMTASFAPPTLEVKGRQCPKGHPMRKFVTPEDDYSCSVCQKRFERGTMLFGCRLCDFDRCTECDQEELLSRRTFAPRVSNPLTARPSSLTIGDVPIDASAIDDITDWRPLRDLFLAGAEVATCPAGHPLMATKAPADYGWTCHGRSSACRARSKHFDTLDTAMPYRCVACNYNICKSCFQVMCKDKVLVAAETSQKPSEAAGGKSAAAGESKAQATPSMTSPSTSPTLHQGQCRTSTSTLEIPISADQEILPSMRWRSPQLAKLPVLNIPNFQRRPLGDVPRHAMPRMLDGLKYMPWEPL